MVGPEKDGKRLSRFQRFEDWYLGKSKVWLWTGLSIVFIGILLGAVRDVNELSLTTLILAGVGTGPSYQGALTVDTLIQHSTEQLLLLGMSFFKLGVGGYIYTIVKNLESTGKHAQSQLAPNTPMQKAPFFRKLFPVLLVLGTDVQFVNVGVIMVIWDLNALNLLNLQFAGIAAGAAYVNAFTIEKVIGTLVVPVEMFGATFMLTGIPLGLASILYNLRLQSTVLLSNTFKVVAGGTNAPESFSSNRSKGPIERKILAMTMTAFAIGISGLLVVAPFRVANTLNIIANTLSKQTTTAAYYSRVLFDRVAGMTTEQWLFIGLGLVIFSINLWLRQIVSALEETREKISAMLRLATGATTTEVEKNLWPAKLALILAVTGFLLMLVNFVVALAADSAFVFQYNAQVAGTSGAAVQQSTINGGVFTILTRNIKFASFGLLLTAVGLNLVPVIINLRQTASTLLNSFPKMITYVAAGRKRPEVPDHISLPGSMTLAPWRSMALIIAGGLTAFSAFFPFSFVEIQNFVQYQTLGFASQTSTAAYSMAFLSERLWEHTLLPLKLTSMGLMLFGIGRTFGTIVGFVKARTTLFREFIDSLGNVSQSAPKKAEPAAPLTLAAVKQR